MKKNFFIMLLMFFLITSPAILLAQGEDADHPLELEEPDGVPIDGGITLLVASGVAYGVKKIYDARKKKEQDEFVNDNDF